MKIAKVKTVPPKSSSKLVTKSKRFVKVGYSENLILAEDDERAKGCFEIFETQADLEKKMKVNSNIWAHYVFKYEINEETKSRYESFFSGFLHYYDTELRNGMSDHTIWCRWHKDKKKDAVTVYLFPAPLRHPIEAGKNAGSKTARDFEAIMSDNNKRMQSTIYKKGWNPPQVQGFQSDPPSPSGPPPPSA